MNSYKALNHWGKCLINERPFAQKLLVASVLGAIGFLLVLFADSVTRSYFPSLIMIAVAGIAIYGGLYLAMFFAVVLSLLADFFFIPPVGKILTSQAGIEQLFIVLCLSIFASYLGSTLRFSLRQNLLARREAARADTAEHAKILMEKVLAMVSHDIRNPLGVIKMAAELILQTQGQVDQHRSILKRMLRNIDQMDLMIQSLLDVERLRAGKSIPLDFTECDLVAEIRRLIEDRSLNDSDRVQLVASAPIYGAWAISGIQRLLQNLVSNAIKYGAPNTPITIGVKRVGERVVISVHNSGPTISLVDQQMIFQAFTRSPNSEKGGVKGWGLGLALVKAISEAHGGSVSITSDEEHGTTLKVELPIRVHAQQASEQPTIAAPPNN